MKLENIEKMYVKMKKEDSNLSVTKKYTHNDQKMEERTAEKSAHDWFSSKMLATFFFSFADILQYAAMTDTLRKQAQRDVTKPPTAHTEARVLFILKERK